MGTGKYSVILCEFDEVLNIFLKKKQTKKTTSST